MNQQQLIIEAIVNAMEPRRVTIDHQYANTGFIRVIDERTLLATRSVSFNFQAERFDFKRVTPGDRSAEDWLASHTYGRERREGQVPAVKSTPIEVVDAVVAYLKGAT